MLICYTSTEVATYKVIQDVEAEDTLIGPLSLRQCIYAAMAALGAYASFVAVAKHMPYLVFLFLPFIAFGAFFAFPWSKQQPTEVWALAKVRFFLKPRRRVWDQTGVHELVTITAPKKIERILTNGLSQTEVKSRLQALADTIDTRGWAVKNVGVNIYNQPGSGPYDSSDRLVKPASMPQEVPNYDTTALVDILDTQTNPLAGQLDQMMSASSDAQRERIVQQLNQAQAGRNVAVGAGQPGMTGQPASAPADYWFLQNPNPISQGTAAQPGWANQNASNTAVVGQPSIYGSSTVQPIPVAATPTAAEEAFIQSHKVQEGQVPIAYGNLRTIQPLAAQTQMPAATSAAPLMPQQAAPQIAFVPVTTALKPATIELVNNNDLSVAAMAHEARRLNSDSPEEVIVSLR